MVWLSRSSYAIADVLNDGVCHYFRLAMATLGGLVPISLYELIMLSMPLIVIITLILAIRRFRSGINRVRFLLNLVGVVLILLAGHNVADRKSVV